MFTKTGLFSILLVVSVSSENILKFYKTSFDYNHDYIENGTSRIKVVDRYNTYGNIEYDLKLGLKNATIHLQFFQFYNQFRPFLVNYRFNVCELLKSGDGFNFFVKGFYRLASKITNSLKCDSKVRTL